MNLYDIVQHGHVVRFKEAVHDQEWYASAGMMARLTGVYLKNNIFVISVCFTEFDDYNKQFEVYDRKSVNYKDNDVFYAEDVLWPQLFEVVSNDPLYLAFSNREDTELTYVEWLENIVRSTILK